MSVVAEIDAVLPRAGVEQQLPVGLLVSNVCAGAPTAVEFAPRAVSNGRPMPSVEVACPGGEGGVMYSPVFAGCTLGGASQAATVTDIAFPPGTAFPGPGEWAHLTATVRIGTHTAPEPAAGQRLQCHIALGAWAGP